MLQRGYDPRFPRYEGGALPIELLERTPRQTRTVNLWFRKPKLFPLSYRREMALPSSNDLETSVLETDILPIKLQEHLVRRSGLEPLKPEGRVIYSHQQLPLCDRRETGALGGTRIPNLDFTRILHYHLCYESVFMFFSLLTVRTANITFLYFFLNEFIPHYGSYV